jgi:hypothetical protein
MEPASEAARFVIRKLSTTHGDLAASHLWTWETARWYELVFALLAKTLNKPEWQVRELTYQMAALDLLHLQSLAALIGPAKAIVYSHPNAERILELFRDRGWSLTQSKRALETVCQCAASLETNFGGKIQLYLRHYAEVMLAELPTYFRFSRLSRDDVSTAFTYWLQNIASSPISLRDDAMDRLCKQNGFTIQELIDAADQFDLNVAFVDDVVQRATLVPGPASRNRPSTR